MLDSINLNNKSFEQIRDEAIAQIPLYSRDWTNYNVSDPGITILENFAAFQALQQGELNEVPDRVKKKLLGLAGFSVRGGSAAEIYVSLDRAGVKLPCAMPSRAKLYAQDICFETAGRMYVRDTGIAAIQADAAQDDGRVQMLLGTQGVRGGVALLGNQPAGREQVLFYIKNLPDAGMKTAIYFELAQRFHRNPMEAGARNPFAAVIWELRTAEGYSRLEVCDETCGFLQSGYVSFTLGKKLWKCAVKDAAKDMYVVRLTVARADYDLVPRFKKVSGLLMHLVQKDTRSDVVPMRILGGNEVCVRHFLLQDGYLEIYGRTRQDGLGSKYRKYHEGLQYRTEYVDGFTRRVVFAEPVPYELIAVCRAESVMVHRKLDMLYGYDNQVIPLPDYAKVYPKAFSVLVVQETENGGELCHLVRQHAADSREVRYTVNERDNTLTVQDCGIYEGAQLWLGEYAVYQGGGGNILAGTELLYAHGHPGEICQQELTGARRAGRESLPSPIAHGHPGEICQDGAFLGFSCCTGAANGCFEEDCAQLQRRFARDVRTPATMVTQGDCECIVRNIPGLSLHKIGVCPVPGRNEIRITVKPNSSQPRPALSGIYIDEITRYLEQYRMLTARIVIEQPVYVPVNVTGVIYAKKHFEGCREKIEHLLRKMLDGIRSDEPFGGRIVFHEIYRQLGAMDCVERIHELSIFPDSYRNAEMSGMDIVLDSNALYYPGSIRIELAEAHGNLD